MKRSEMFDKILNIVYSYSLDLGDGLREGQCREQTHYILKEIEEAGMKPPHNDKEGYSSEEWLENMEWEPEDKK